MLIVRMQPIGGQIAFFSCPIRVLPEEDGGPIGGEGDPGDFGEDMGRPAEQAPYDDEPVEGDRCYRLEELDLDDSDDELDVEEAGAPSSRRQAGGVCDAEQGYAAFLMQAAVEDPDLAVALPEEEVVDLVFGAALPVPASARAWRMRCRLEEELTMMELFIARLHGPAFVAWARRDGVLLRDIASAAERLRHTFLSKIVELEGDDGWSTA